ncbi:hypothetical protein K439DRAFT_1241011, partial [Ramaria rubella]
PFVLDFLTSFAAFVVTPVIEASRKHCSFLLGYPVIIGIIYQVMSGAVTLPIYWAIFLAFTRDDVAGSVIDQASAEAILFGLVMGYVFPTLGMVFISTPNVIAFWQAFPIHMSLLGQLYLLIRPKRGNGDSGYRTVQATYMIIFVISSIVHLRTYKFDLQYVINAWIPSTEIPDANKGHTALYSIIHFLQWDAAFIFGSTFLASLWFANSVVQSVKLLVWVITSSILLGPGAAVSGVFLWR